MKVLVACEFSGVVRRAFRERGHDAWSCDLLPAEDGSEFHFEEDVIYMLARHARMGYKWDLMIAHPPCTYLCNSGVRWLHSRPERWQDMDDGADFFKRLLDANIARVAIENPIMHKYAVSIIGRRQDQIIQPWQFGHGETKATCLWLKNLPKLVPTRIVKGRKPKVHFASPGPDRWRERSITYTGIARAMADQWGSL